MNTRKTVYNKLFKEETKLATHEIDLAITDKLKVELKNYTALISKYGEQLDDLYVPVREIDRSINELKGNSPAAVKIAQDLRKQEDLVSNEIETVTKKINQTKSELGIDIKISELVDLSSLQSSNTISSRIQNDAAALVKYVSTLKNPTI
jgi:uncharacterized protein YoxC